MGVKHRVANVFRKFSALDKLGFGRTVKCFEMLYVSYPRPSDSLINHKYLLVAYNTFGKLTVWTS